MALDGINLTYHQDEQGHMTPDIEWINMTEIGKYGRLRLNFLYEHNQKAYGQMLLDGTLEQHLREVNEEATERVHSMVEQMRQKENLNEDLKNTDPLRWAGTMNNLKNSAEEIVLSELIYT